MGWYPCCCSTQCDCTTRNCEIGLTADNIADGTCSDCEWLDTAELKLQPSGSNCEFIASIESDAVCYGLTVTFDFTFTIDGTDLTLVIEESPGGAIHEFSGTATGTTCEDVETATLTHDSTTGTAYCNFSSVSFTTGDADCGYFDWEGGVGSAECYLVCGDPGVANSLTENEILCGTTGLMMMNITGSTFWDPCLNNALTDIDGDYHIINIGNRADASCSDLQLCPSTPVPSGTTVSLGGSYGGDDVQGTAGCWDSSGFQVLPFDCWNCYYGYTCNGATYPGTGSWSFDIQKYGTELIFTTVISAWFGYGTYNIGFECNPCSCYVGTAYNDCTGTVDYRRWVFQGRTDYERATCDPFTVDLELVRTPTKARYKNGCVHILDLTGATVTWTWDQTA